MSELTLAQKAMFSALSAALNKSLAFYAIDKSPSAFDTVASVVEACFNAGYQPKPSLFIAVQDISHYEKPYYYYIDPETGTVRYALGGGIPEKLPNPRHATKRKGILQ